MDPDAASARRISVIGIGSRLRRDDAAGWAVVDCLAHPSVRRMLPPGTARHLCDADPARLVSLWEGATLAVVTDAAKTVPPQAGRVHRLELGRDALRQAPATTSSHGFSLHDALVRTAGGDGRVRRIARPDSGRPV